MKKIKNLIFDLDGTLWDSREQVINAWKIALKDHCDINITKDELTSLMGKTNDEYINKLFKNVNKSQAKEYMTKCEIEEVNYLSNNGANIYKDTIQVIIELSKKYNLFIVSNCQDGYIDSFLNFYKLNNYFLDYECNGRTGLNKSENIKLIIDRNSLDSSNCCYIGDTLDDYNSSIKNDIIFIYAKYGFDSNLDCKFSINSIKELPEKIEGINLSFL